MVLARDARPADDPALVLRAAAAAAQAGLRLAPAHRRSGWPRECPPLPEPWPRAAPRRRCSACSAPGRPAVPVWEALDQAGLAARLLPDWERVRSRPQRNAVHRFTVDRHLVETAVGRPRYARRVDRPDLLLVGALLHDIGKGWPGDHSEAGVAVVADLAPRLGFGPDDVDDAGDARPPPPAAPRHRHPARPRTTPRRSRTSPRPSARRRSSTCCTR